ncbi:ankyrin repeat-containing protein [Colletotrichum zoysiae]|uniref:Ankyrin repeat-containing protein n=1 Tax=Colletotrichum zoysiae TaxID=1216348 RepID=A0AAD9HME6_9PEZI|nr:ankyrin repeat-containing protein [Colletotrichum zoysiae]
MGPNPYLLAADNPAALLTLLCENPAIASGQDEHGYSLVHAAASYNHLDLLRALVREFGVNVDLRDEDDETALFVVETVDAAKCLVEELGADMAAKGADGVTASQKIEAEADYPEVAEYLKGVESQRTADATAAAATVPAGTTESGAQPTTTTADTAAPPVELPPVPEGLAVTLGTMDQAEEVPEEVDPEFKRRIEQLAEREDFHTPEGQAELRRLIEDAILDQGLSDERSVRQKQA